MISTPTVAFIFGQEFLLTVLDRVLQSQLATSTLSRLIADQSDIRDTRGLPDCRLALCRIADPGYPLCPVAVGGFSVEGATVGHNG